MEKTDTIAAIATPPGRGGVAIVRISGDNAEAIMRGVFRPVGKSAVFNDHEMYFGHVTDEKGEVIDECMAVLFKAPRSYTREDVAELQVHGGRIPAERTLERVLRAGARMAQPGEFTRRAFENGRIDLSQAEAVMDVIASESALAEDAAKRRLSGELRKLVEKMQSTLQYLLARLDAAADFPDEDLDDETRAECRTEFASALERLDSLIDRASSSRRINDGTRVAIFGAPNAGKSSLLNLLLGDDRAIVTPTAGTTRDTIEERIEISGLLFILTDTAGIRESSDEIERIGVDRAKKTVSDSDILLFVVDAAETYIPDIGELPDRPTVVLLNKSDLEQKLTQDELAEKFPKAELLSISALTGEGAEELRQTLTRLALSGNEPTTDGVLIGNARHLEALTDARCAIARGLDSASANMPVDILSVDITEAWQALGRITGRTCGEDIIGEIFEKFCVGK